MAISSQRLKAQGLANRSIDPEVPQVAPTNALLKFFSSLQCFFLLVSPWLI